MAKRKYEWSDVQAFYDAGNSWREVCQEFGMAFRSLQKARDRGDLVTTRSSGEGVKLSYEKGKRKRPTFSEEWRKRTSERQSLTNSGGRCRWYQVGDQKVQGTWERDAGMKLNDMGIKWRKLKNKVDVLWYELDGKMKAYTPDFLLPDFDVLLEFKGYWWGRDREKMAAVMAQHPNLKIVIIEKDEFHRLLEGEIVW